MSVSDIPQKHVVEAQTRPSLWEEGPIPLVADLGKGTRRRREQVRNQEQIADVRPPLQLRSVADECPRKAPEDRVVVPDRQPLVYPTPDDFERHHAWLALPPVT